MATTMKAQEIIHGIKEELDLRLGLTQATALLSSTITFETLSTDVSDGTTRHAMLLVGDGIATHSTFRIVVKPIEWALAFDVLGLASPVYTPHEILYGVEAVSGAGTEPMTTLTRSIVLAVLAARGCRITVFEIGTGDSFDNADFANANKLGVIEPSTKYPMVMSQ